MQKINVILVFDIGKTNKKALLFDQKLKIQFEEEEKFPEINDDDGFPCDDIVKMEAWIDQTLAKFLHHDSFNVVAVNFTTYGATLVCIDRDGKRLTPAYNYLKPMPDSLVEPLYKKYGGINEFCRKTASPALGSLNSGLQILWLKNTKPHIYSNVENILHFPQYLAFRLNHTISSEHTSIGCHTAMWDFDQSDYHKWLNDEGIHLPDPVPVETVYEAEISGKKVKTGIGIHDSSASLAPYLLAGKDEFLLLSTGTWCINMNPFNYSPLTAEQLRNDSLCYMSIHQKPVKSSRVFLGHIHDVNVQRLTEYFKVAPNQYKKVTTDTELLKGMLKEKDSDNRFFKNEMPENYIDTDTDPGKFKSFDEAYHRLMVDLTNLVIKSLANIIPEKDKIKSIYISGGFAKNELFTRLLATHFNQKKIYTSEIDNATSLGAALVLYDQFGLSTGPELDLGLKKIESVYTIAAN